MNLLNLLNRRPSFPPIFTKQGVARLYEYGGRYFVCSVAGIAETDSLTELQVGADDANLGQAVVYHLMEYDTDDRRDLRGRASEWPAYKRSGAKSVKGFESKLWHVDLSLKDGTVTAAARPRLSLKEHIAVRGIARVHLTDNVGRSVRESLEAAKALREAELI